MTTIRITPGATGQSVKVRVYTDAGYANVSPLAYNATGLSVSYARDNGAPVAIALVALSSATAAYSSGGWIHVGAGVYRLDLPDAAVAAGASMVAILVADAADIRADAPLIVLDVATSTRSAFDPATQTVRADVRQIKGDGSEDVLDGLRAIGAGYTSDGTLNANVSTFDAFAVGQIGAAKPGDAMTLTAGERTSVGVAVWSDAATYAAGTKAALVSALYTLLQTVSVEDAQTLSDAAALLARADPITLLNAINAKTVNLPASPAAVGSAMTLADGAISAAKVATAALIGKGDWNTVVPNNAAIATAASSAEAARVAALEAVNASDAVTEALGDLATAVGGIQGGSLSDEDRATIVRCLKILESR